MTEKAMFDDYLVPNPSKDEAEAIDRHNAGVEAVAKGMMVLVGGIAAGVIGGALVSWF